MTKYNISSRDEIKNTIAEIRKEVDRSNYSNTRKKTLLNIIHTFQTDNALLGKLALQGYDILTEEEKQKILYYAEGSGENTAIFELLKQSHEKSQQIVELIREKNAIEKAKTEAENDLIQVRQELQEANQAKAAAEEARQQAEREKTAAEEATTAAEDRLEQLQNLTEEISKIKQALQNSENRINQSNQLIVDYEEQINQLTKEKEIAERLLLEERNRTVILNEEKTINEQRIEELIHENLELEKLLSQEREEKQQYERTLRIEIDDLYQQQITGIEKVITEREAKDKLKIQELTRKLKNANVIKTRKVNIPQQTIKKEKNSPANEQIKALEQKVTNLQNMVVEAANKMEEYLENNAREYEDFNYSRTDKVRNNYYTNYNYNDDDENISSITIETINSDEIIHDNSSSLSSKEIFTEEKNAELDQIANLKNLSDNLQYQIKQLEDEKNLSDQELTKLQEQLKKFDLLKDQIKKMEDEKNLSDQELAKLQEQLKKKVTSERITTALEKFIAENKTQAEEFSQPYNSTNIPAQSDDFNVKLIEATKVAFGGSKFAESVNKVMLANRFINATKSSIKNKTFAAEESLKEQFYFDQNETKLRDSEFNNYVASTQRVSDVEIEYYKTHRQKILADRGIKNLANASDQEIIAEIVKDKVAAIIKILPKVVEKLNVDNPKQVVNEFNAAEITVLLSVGNPEALEQWRNANKDGKINQSFLGELNKSSQENAIRNKAVDNFVTIIKKYGDLFAQGEVSRKILNERNDKEQLSKKFEDKVSTSLKTGSFTISDKKDSLNAKKQLIDMIDKIYKIQTASELEIKYHKEKGKNNLGSKSDQEISEKIIADKVLVIVKVLPEVAKKLNVKNPQQAINKLSTSEMTALLSVGNSQALRQWLDNNQDGKIYNSFVGQLDEKSPENAIRLQAMQNFVQEYKDLLLQYDNIINQTFGGSKPKTSPSSLDVKHISSNDRSRGG